MLTSFLLTFELSACHILRKVFAMVRTLEYVVGYKIDEMRLAGGRVGTLPRSILPGQVVCSAVGRLMLLSVGVAISCLHHPII
jgi:hypothetical protein